MDQDDIRRTLNGIFREVFDNNLIEIFDEMTAKDVVEWDSLNHINLIVAVERKFNIQFTTKEVTSLEKIGDLIALIQKKLG